MKKNLAVIAAVIVMATFLVGCGKKESPTETEKKEAIKSLSDFAETQQKLGEAYDKGDPAAAAKMMDSYAQFGAQLEAQEFEKSEAVDAPSDFPSSLIYGKGKITQSSDNSDADYINKSITIKTTEDVKAVKEFYKTLLSQAPWKITSQSSETDGASYDAKDASDREANVDISANTYSKIVEIQISYSGNAVKQ